MKKTKDQKGITLIALIITIVVLLILAGVAIGTLKESNIIGKAEDAVSSYEEAKGKEEQEIKDSEEMLDKYISGAKQEVGIKLYSFDGGVGILTPENEMNIFYSSSSLFPDQTFDVSEISKKEVEDLGVILDFDENENLIFLTGSNVVCAVTTDRNKIYMPIEDETTGNVTISKSVYAEHQELLLEQYCSEDVYYHMPEYVNKNECIYSIENGRAYDLKHNTCFPITFTYKGIISSDETTTVHADGSEIEIREGAQKFEVTAEYLAETLIAYLQDNNLYFMDRCGTPTKFINTGALPTEQN